MSVDSSRADVRVAGIQMDVILGDVAGNLQRMEVRLREAAEQGARLVVFPECALTGYCFESLAEAQPFAQGVPGPATNQLAVVCQELGVWCVFGLLESDAEAVYNTAALVGPEGLIGRYRKTHLPHLGVDNFTTPGDEPYEVFDCGGLKVGLLICYDGSFPEAARCLTLAGADLICLPTNWPPGAESFARHLINARALENNVYFLAVNRVGEERGFRFIGTSRLCNPNGDDLAVLGEREETILFGRVDPARARQKHLVRVPGKHEIHRLHDRRPDLYDPVVKPLEGSPFHGSPADDGVTGKPPLHRQLWAPWRLAYVTDANAKPKLPSQMPPPTQSWDDYPPDLENCFVCRAWASEDDRENLVIHRTDLTITLLNRFPYNNGHLLVVPALHKAELSQLTAEELLDCQRVITHMIEVIRHAMNAQGFNVGLNLGGVAGAGLPGHLHWHIVPRWAGDTNFMPTVAGTRVIPQALDALWEILTNALRAAPLPAR